MTDINNSTAIPKLAAVSMVRNECDILELFIKINARIFDVFYILDHHSSDGTAEIIKKLQEKGYSIEYRRLPDIEYDQAKITTGIVREVANKNIFDYIFPIDADEFLYLDGKFDLRETLCSLLPTHRYGILPWKTYCPVSADFFQIDAPLYENFLMREHEPTQFYKVVLGNEFAKKCSLSKGNHKVFNKKFSSEAIILPFWLQHVPVRSAEQLIKKVILVQHISSLRTNKKIGQSFHVDMMAKKIRELDYRISFDDLLKIAINYANKEDEDFLNKLVNDSPRIGLSHDTIEFKELASINLVQTFDKFSDDLVGKLRSTFRYQILSKVFAIKFRLASYFFMIAKKLSLKK